MISLMEYLQQGPAGLPIAAHGMSRNTTNSVADVQVVGTWEAFNLNTILARFNNLLTTTTVDADPFPTSPPGYVNNESAVRTRITRLMVPRIRRALRAAFEYLAEREQMDGLTPVNFEEGFAAAFINSYQPDLAYFSVNVPFGEGANRAPGDIIPSWKWTSRMCLGSEFQRKEYKQVLSQVNFYAQQHGSRYGCVMTDGEFVAIRRLGNGRLEVSRPVLWESHGSVEQPRLTVLLALWYLGMLAANDTGAESWSL